MTDQFRFRVIPECNFILVVDIVELLFGNVDSSFRDKVDFALFKDVVQVVNCVVESCCSDLSLCSLEIDA